MKKQIKEKQNAEPKQNSTPSENRPSVSDETKQKLVKQYADRAEKESSKQNPVDWGYFNSPKFGSPVDERKQIANSAEVSPKQNITPPALQSAETDADMGARVPTYDDLRYIVDAKNANLKDKLTEYDPGYMTRIQPNPLYGYGQADADSYYEIGKKGFDDWYDTYFPTDQDRAMMDRAFNLMQNYRLYEDAPSDRARREEALYGDALMALQQRAQNDQAASILDSVLQRRLPSRQRNITGEGDWWSVNPNYIPR